jgi:hypothetical protein
MKMWLKDGGVYGHIVSDILSDNKTLNKDTGQTNSNRKIALDDPGIKAVASKTFSPEFLQTTVEKVIDGTTPWLNGKTPKPTFQIDISQVKNEFADNIGVYARSRYDALPVCAGSQPTNTDDILTISCRPPGYNPAPEVQKAVTDLKTSPDFLGQTSFNSDNLTTGNGNDKQPLFQKLDKAPRVYRLAKLAPIVLGVLSLLDALIIIFWSTVRRSGIRRVATSLYLTGGLLMLEVWGIGFGLGRATDKISSSSSDHKSLQTTAISVIEQIQKSINHSVLIFAVSFLVIAALFTIYLIASRQKIHKTDESKPEIDTAELPETQHPIKDKQSPTLDDKPEAK